MKALTMSFLELDRPVGLGKIKMQDLMSQWFSNFREIFWEQILRSGLNLMEFSYQ